VTNAENEQYETKAKKEGVIEMKRKPTKKRSSLKRKLKYLLLLLLLSFNFTFALGYIGKLNEKIDKLSAQVQAQQALINSTESQLNGIQNTLTAHEMKINILSKAEPTKVVQTIYKAAETIPQHLPHLPHIQADPIAMAATIGVAVKVAVDFMGDVASGFSGILH
jgi:hypothetical protein